MIMGLTASLCEPLTESLRPLDRSLQWRHEQDLVALDQPLDRSSKLVSSTVPRALAHSVAGIFPFLCASRISQFGVYALWTLLLCRLGLLL